MRTFAVSLLVLAASAATVHADGPEAVPSSVLAAPLSSSFGGAYAGLEYGRGTSSGDITLSLVGGPATSPVSFDSGDGYGAFAGYNFQNGRFVYGGELRYLLFDGLGLTNLDIGDVLDLRGRVGLAAGSLLVYGALGWSWASTSTGSDSGSLNGLNYGLGAEYNLTQRFMVGLDYTGRDMDGDFNPDTDFSGSVNTVSIRGGLRF